MGFDADRDGNATPIAALARFRRPIPRIAEGQALAPLVTAMMDISDGLLLDALRMASASGVTIAITAAAVPMSVDFARRDAAMRWGDDYELLFTLPPGIEPPVTATCIGTVHVRSSGPLLIDGVAPDVGKPLGYQH